MSTAFAERKRDRRGLGDRVEILTGGTHPADGVHDEVAAVMEEVGLTSPTGCHGRLPERLRSCGHVTMMGCSTLDAGEAGDVDVRDWALDNKEEETRQGTSWAKAAIETTGVVSEVVITNSLSDRTPEIADQTGTIAVTPDEPEYGNGYKCSFNCARGDYIAIGDADTMYDFEESPKPFERAMSENADIVPGSRLNSNIKRGAMPPRTSILGVPC